MSIAEEKQRLRRRLRAQSLPPASIDPEEAAVRAAEHVCSLPEFESAAVLALYSATSTELGTRHVFEVARDMGKRCVYPRCTDAGTLEFAEVSALEALVEARFGILEPPPEFSVLDLAELDLVLVPGLAFDPAGRRLGRGAGYYDRALAGMEASVSPSSLIGFAYSVLLIDSVPVESHDRGMDAVVTERGVLRVESGEIE
ncbi:MAG: 5-formyltetrahydrofolate cyclo-ligase [Myxococcota bacterium]|jgi:5-formyltetrahydrofolate cyclo-ligase|nr:5-formyltetrahydrofolate cyclo-ligase [Myxococcota bacterium]